MLKIIRAGALALVGALACAASAHAACPTPTYTGLTGKDASNATQTMQTITSGGAQLATPAVQGVGSSGSPAPITVDSNCNLQVTIPAGLIPDLGTGSTPAPNTTNAYLQTLVNNISAPIPAGTNNIGVVGVAQGVSTSGLYGSLDQCAAQSTQPSASTANTTAAVGCDLIGSLWVGGPAADNSTAAGNPLRDGGVARTTEGTPATAGQVASLMTDLAHKLVTSPYATKENLVSGQANTNGAAVQLVAAPDAGLYLYLTSVSCFNSGATGTTVSLENGNGGPTIWQGYAPAGGGGFVVSFNTPLGGINSMTAATPLYVAAGSATSNLYCNASGFKGS